MKYLNILDQLFDKNIDEAKRQEILEEMNFNTEMKNEYSELLILRKALSRKDAKDKLSFLKQIEQENTSKEKWLTIKKILIPISIAASLIFIISYFSYPLHSINKSNIYSHYYESYPSLDAMRSNGENVTTEKMGYTYFNQEKYAQAIEILSKFTTEKPMFYHALSLSNIGRIDEGIIVLNSISTNKENLPIAYYKGLLYAQMKEYDKAKNSFLAVPSEPKYFKLKSLEILEILEK